MHGYAADNSFRDFQVVERKTPRPLKYLIKQVMTLDTQTQLINKAKEFGATSAGIADAASLQKSRSHVQDGKKDRLRPESSVLVLALQHDSDRPELDWWDGEKGTLGNRKLIDVSKSLAKWIKDTFNIDTRDLAYHVENGGIYLKDAAVIAGLGIIGKNNLLVTPEFGPRVRFRALHMDMDIPSTGQIELECCDNCPMPCREACPQNAFKDGYYSRQLCREQMNRDVQNRTVMKMEASEAAAYEVIKYCRACEFACPVGNSFERSK